LKRKISLMKQFLGLLRNFPHSDRLPKNTDSDKYGSISFGQFSGVSNQEHSMGSPIALIKPKTRTCRDESRSSSRSPVSQGPCWEIQCYIGRSLVLFLNHFDWIWLPHDELPPSFPKWTIASQKLTVTVVWNPHGFQGL
jgi:hypothetical protein